MPHDGQRAVMHLLSDSVSGANWRPTRFEDDRLRFTCCVCHVLSDMAVLLRCAHTLCEDCLTGCVVQDGGSVCPLDGKPFCDADCQKIKIYAQAKRYLKAHCWNEADGCQFVGTIEAVLLHFEKGCTFHALQCPRCEQRILRTGIAAHYITGCSQSACCAKGAQPNGPSTC